jgi:hypothetical protein
VIQATLSRSEVALELVALSESGALLPAQLPDVPATLLARVMGLVGDAGSVWKVSIRLLEQGLELIRHTGTLLSSQLVPVRAGVDEAAPEHFAFEQRLGTAQAQLSVRREQTRQLSLTFSLPQGAAGMGAASAFKVELWEKERLRSVRTPQAGTVIFGQVDPGEYRLVVLEKGKKTGEVELSLLHS